MRTGPDTVEMKAYRVVLIALALGISIAALSGLVDNTPRGLLGAVHYGYPLPWWHQVVYPGVPVEFDPVILLVDISFWTVVSGLVLFLLGSMKKS